MSSVLPLPPSTMETPNSDSDPNLSFPTEPAYLVPVEVRDIPRLGPGHKGVFALEVIPAQTKTWAWTDRVEKIHHTQLADYISRNFRKRSDGEIDLEGVRIFLRQGFVLPGPARSEDEAGDDDGGAGDRPDDYFNSNPTDAGRFTNHSNDPNCGQGVALRDIRAGEELTLDYGYHGEPTWYKDICAQYGVLTEAQVAAKCAEES